MISWLTGFEVHDGRIEHGVIRLVRSDPTRGLPYYSSALLAFSHEVYSAKTQDGEVIVSDSSGDEILAIGPAAFTVILFIHRMQVFKNGWLINMDHDPRHIEWLQNQFTRIDNGQASSASDKSPHFQVDRALEGQQLILLRSHQPESPYVIDQNNNLVAVQAKYPFASKSPLIMPGDD